MASSTKRRWTGRDSSQSEGSDDDRTECSRRRRRADSSVTSRMDTVLSDPPFNPNDLPLDTSATDAEPFRDRTTPNDLMAQTGLHEDIDGVEYRGLDGLEETDGIHHAHGDEPFALLPNSFGDFEFDLADFIRLSEGDLAFLDAATPTVPAEDSPGASVSEHEHLLSAYEPSTTDSSLSLERIALRSGRAPASATDGQPDGVDPVQLVITPDPFLVTNEDTFPVTNENTFLVTNEDTFAVKHDGTEQDVVGEIHDSYQEDAVPEYEDHVDPETGLSEESEADAPAHLEDQHESDEALVAVPLIDPVQRDDKPIVDKPAARCCHERRLHRHNEDGTWSCAHLACKHPETKHRRSGFKKHYRSHEKENYRRCPALGPEPNGSSHAMRQCPYEARFPRHLQSHVDSVHLGIKARCPVCGHVEARHDNLIGKGRHFQKMHPNADLPKPEATRQLPRHPPNVTFLYPPETVLDQWVPGAMAAAAAPFKGNTAGPSRRRQRPVPSSSETQNEDRSVRQSAYESLVVGSVPSRVQTQLHQRADLVDESMIDPELGSTTSQQAKQRRDNEVARGLSALRYQHLQRQQRQQQQQQQQQQELQQRADEEEYLRQLQELWRPAQEQFLRQQQEQQRRAQEQLLRQQQELQRQIQEGWTRRQFQLRQQYEQQQQQLQLHVRAQLLDNEPLISGEWTRRQAEQGDFRELQLQGQRDLHAPQDQLSRNTVAQLRLTPSPIQQDPVARPVPHDQMYHDQSQHQRPAHQPLIESRNQDIDDTQRGHGDQSFFQGPPVNRPSSHHNITGLVYPLPSVSTPPPSRHASSSESATPMIARQLIGAHGSQPGELPSPPETVARGKRERHGSDSAATLGDHPPPHPDC